MRATVTEHQVLTDQLGSNVTGKSFYLAPFTAEEVTDYLTENGYDTGGITYAAYVQLCQSEQCYKLLYPVDVAIRRTIELNANLPVPISLLAKFDEQRSGMPKQLVKLAVGNLDVLPMESVGDILHVCAADKYMDHDYVVLEGPAAGRILDESHLQEPDPDFVNPYRKVVGKAIKLASQNVLPKEAVGYYVPLAHCTATNEYFLLLGRCAGMKINSAADVFKFATDEREQEIFARKVVYPFQLMLQQQVQQLLASCNQNTVGTHLNYYAGSQYKRQRIFLVGQNPCNYLAIDTADHTRVSFLPQAKLASVLEKGQDPWTSSMRQVTTWGKIAAMFFNPAIFTARDVDTFSTAAVASAMELFGPEQDKPELVLVSGNEIGKYYSSDTYQQIQGSLGNSCMRAKPASYFDIYSKNPDKCQLLICRDRQTGKIYGRALFWTDDAGVKYIDRRYGTTPAVEQRMLTYAQNKLGALNIWSGSQLTPGKDTCVCTLQNYLLKEYPYIDSMCFLDVTTGVLTNKQKRGGDDKVVQIKTQSGQRPIAHNIEAVCAQSSIIGPKDKMKQLTSGNYAFPEYVKTLRSGAFEIETNCVVDDLEGGLIHKSNTAIASFIDESGVTRSKQTTKNSACIAVNTGGILFVKENLVLSVLDGGYILRSNAVELPDGSFCSSGKQAEGITRLRRRRVNAAHIPVPIAVEAVAA